MTIMAEENFEVVALEDAHIPLLMEIDQEAYPDPWSQGMFRQELVNRSSFFYVFLSKGVVVAYGGFWLVVDEIHITKLTVAQAWRKHGIGRALLDYLLREGMRLKAETVCLEVRESNEAARELYRKARFEEVAIRYGYYAQSGENAVLMRRLIAPTD